MIMASAYPCIHYEKTIWGNITYPWVVLLLITGARKLTSPKKHAERGVLTASGISTGGGT